jgi:hypothetical protein
LPENAVVQQQSTPQPSTSQPVAALQAQPTPTLILVDNRMAVPEGCIELVNNGSFEARGTGWSQAGGTILPEYSMPQVMLSSTTSSTTGGAAQGGTAIRLGLVDKSSIAGISATQQVIQLPKDRDKITLRFRYFPLYDSPPSPGDFQYVDIYHGDSGQFMGRALGVQKNDRVWIDREYDLSALAGETVRIFFMVSNDGAGGNIAMYVDNVSVLACRVAKPQNGLAVAPQIPQPITEASTSQPPVAARVAVSQPPEKILADRNLSFGRMGGLLVVFGIVGAALVLLPLTKRLTK